MTLHLALGLSVALCAGLAQAQGTDALGWLRKIHDATHKLSYSGTFVYQNGTRSETSRITRFVDASGDIEKVEVMDGVPREIVRTRDTVRCYLPDSRVVKVERQIDRAGAERGFPIMLPERIHALERHYDIAMGDTQRVAGFDCRTVTLTPKDDLRYGHKLYADVKSGMLLKAETFDSKGGLVEQFSFTQLIIGGISRDRVKPRHAAQSWRVENSTPRPRALAAGACRASYPGFARWRSSSAAWARGGRSGRWCTPTGWQPSRCSSSRSKAAAIRCAPAWQASGRFIFIPRKWRST